MTGFLPDGTVTLDDGRTMQAVVSVSTGALGVRPKTDDDRVSALDQYVPPRVEQVAAPAPLPTLASLGLDQA